jgi:hypothetical protein
VETVAFRIRPEDTVATLLADAPAGPVGLRGGGADGEIVLLEPIELGHKVALRDTPEGTRIVKYGVAIGIATREIRRGEWVHLHNCRSAFDERSSSLDPHTGAASEISYE